MNRCLTASTLLGALALTGSTLASAQPAAPPAAKAPECFFISEWNNWVAPDEHTMYIRVGVSRVYKLGFAQTCSEMTQPFAHLITQVRGSSSICSPIDIDLKVSEDHGISEPCIVTDMTELTPAQIAALPKNAKP